MTRSEAIIIFNWMTIEELEKIYADIEDSVDFEKVISYIAEEYDD